MPLTALTSRFALVDPPGVVRATSGMAELSPGETVEAATGVSFDALVEVAQNPGVIVTPRGRFQVRALRDGAGAVSGLLLVQEAAPSVASSTLPPPSSSPRVAPDLAWVLGRDSAARAACDLAMRFAKTMLPVYIAAEAGCGAEELVWAVARARSGPRGEERHVRGGDPASVATLFEPSTPAPALLVITDLHLLDVDTGARLARELDRGAFSETQLAGCGRELRDAVSGLSAGHGARGREFSRELYTLLRGSTVSLPPLRDREDLEHLISLALAEVARDESGPVRGKLSVAPDALRKLKGHSWPGNISELRHWLRRAAAAAAPACVLTAEHFPFEDEPQGPFEPSRGEGLRRTAERAALEEALRAASGNVSIAAKKLGVARSTLYRLMLRHGIVR